MIYCVEDDMNIRQLVTYTLESTGMRARGFEDGEQLFAGLEQEIPDLILLDIMLPGEDGISILGRLKKNLHTQSIPVIMLTAKGSEYDKITGLDSGADDYVAKPFGMMELVSRIKAVLRRTGRQSEDAVLTAHQVTLDVQKHQVLVGIREVTLTLKEYDLLELLLRHKNRVLTRETILENVWGYDYTGETRTLDVHVRTLRKKLDVDADFIETVRGVGYRISDS